MRVLHGPTNVGNQPWTLSRAERALGITSDVIVNHGSWLQYPSDRTLTRPGEKRWVGLARRIIFALLAPFHYDVIHYYFGQTYLGLGGRGKLSAAHQLVRLADLHLARLLGRKTFMTLQGCDIRLAGESNRINATTPCCEGRCSLFSTCLSELDDSRRRMRDTVLPLIDRVFYLNPELGRYVPSAEFLPYASAEMNDVQVVLPDLARARPRLVHAPSNGDIKGTPHILAALDALKTRYDFELILIQNMPHAKAMEVYRSADVAIDQLYAGWYGGFAVEAMAMGKPVAAYIREDDRSFVPPAMWSAMPILRIAPDTLEADLARILDRRSEWPAIGAASRRYVLDWHDPSMIAMGLRAVYLNSKASLVLGPTRKF